jgi:HEAT repeat protein
MLSFLFALALTQQDLNLGTVDVGGRAVSVTVPSLRGPFSGSTPHVEVDGWNYAVDASGNLGVRYRSDGGWGEVADAYPAAAQKAATATEYRVKVFLYTNSEILEEGRDGVWLERRGFLSTSEVDEVYSALARFKALAEVAAGGSVRVTFDVAVDDDLLFRVSRGSSEEFRRDGFTWVQLQDSPATNALIGPEFIHDQIAPRFNNDPFESEDKVYRGPYSSVFVIHPLKTWDVGSYIVDRTPVTSVSWSTFSDRKAGDAMAIQLFYAWIGHLGAAARATMHDVGMNGFVPSGADLPVTPQVFRVPLTPELLRLGNHSVTTGYGDGSPSALLPMVDRSEAGWTAPRGRKVDRLVNGQVVVHSSMVSTFEKAHPGARAVGRLVPRNGHWGWVVYDAPGVDVTSDVAALDRKPRTMPAAAMESPGPEVGEIAMTPFGVGDFVVTADGAIQENGYNRRGYAVLAMAEPGKALFRATADNGIKLRILNELGDAYVLRLVTRSGKDFDLPMYGEVRVPPEVGDAPAMQVFGPLKPSASWSEFGASLAPIAGEDVVEVRIAPPQYASYYERVSAGTKPVKVADLSVGAVTPTVGTPPTVSDEIAWLKGLKAPLDAVAVSRLRLILANRNSPSRLQALGAMNFIKNPDLIPEIATARGSSSPGESFLAINALRLQDDDKAWSQIAFAALEGPLGHTFTFAATALAAKKEDVTLDVLGASLLARSHYARLAAVRSVNGIDSEQAAIVASAALSEGDPDPSVRMAIVGQKRPKSELFARRVLWEAVNDESEWVRATAYITLLDSPFEEIRDQALRGVRDESVAIRLALLREMIEHPSESYRPALRTAVADQVPYVRATALRAFAAMPGDVAIEEIKNTVGDKNPLVQEALKELAQKKGLQIPPQR